MQVGEVGDVGDAGGAGARMALAQLAIAVATPGDQPRRGVHEQCDVRAQALAGGVQRGVDRR